jgi:hypothetical protein
MKKRIYVYLGLTVILLSGIVGFLYQMPTPQAPAIQEWEIVLDLRTPYGSYLGKNPNFASIAFSEEPKVNPEDEGLKTKYGVEEITPAVVARDKLDDILGDWGRTGQYWTWDLIENTSSNGKYIYLYSVYGLSDDYLTEYDIPPIRQDNENINFCFYVAHGTYPVGSYSWWDTINGDLTFTLILPEGYDLRTDVLRPVGWFGPAGEKDSEYSIFTSAHTELENEQRPMNLTKEFKDNRWRITVKWEKGKFDKFNTPLYLEVHYRKIQP